MKNITNVVRKVFDTDIIKAFFIMLISGAALFLLITNFNHIYDFSLLLNEEHKFWATMVIVGCATFIFVSLFTFIASAEVFIIFTFHNIKYNIKKVD